MRPCSYMAPQPVYLCENIHSLPYGHPPEVVLWSLQTPFCCFRGGLGAPLSPSSLNSMDTFLFPSEPVGCPLGHLKGVVWETLARQACGATYYHESPHFHAWSAEAAIYIMNWMSYSSQARLCKAFCRRHSTV